MTTAHIFLYGPPGSGKSSVGEALATDLEMNFIDLDNSIVAAAGKPIPEIFSHSGESEFRQLESALLTETIQHEKNSVIALGGGTLLASANRQLANSAGVIICLQAATETLLNRLNTDPDSRPLLIGNRAERLRTLLTDRKQHYESFPIQIRTDGKGLEEILGDICFQLGKFRVRGMGTPYDIRIEAGSSQSISSFLSEQLSGRKVILVTDEHVNTYHGSRISRQFSSLGSPAEIICVPPGETSKSIAQLSKIWESLLQAGTDRKSILVALGGGVVGDLAGFAAATFLRGIQWINLPTTLLAQVDAGIGGKTGINLPQGKNLVGAFFPPSLVLIDPELLETLPSDEINNGMAEVVKHGVIADPILFECCQMGKSYLSASRVDLVKRAAAVKIQIIQIDPFETSLRQALNFGHTIGHAVEKVQNYRLKHGEAIAIGMVAETYIAGRLGLASINLHRRIADVLQKFDLPTQIPVELPTEVIIDTARYDKKREANTHRFALPVEIGKIKIGVEVENLSALVADFRRSYSP